MELETRGNLVEGPNMFDLMLALFTGKRVIFTIEFKNGMKALMETQINAIEAEDGSRESWNITGYITAVSSFSGHRPGPLIPEDSIERRFFWAYFQTRRRSGVIKY